MYFQNILVKEPNSYFSLLINKGVFYNGFTSSIEAGVVVKVIIYLKNENPKYSWTSVFSMLNVLTIQKL